MKLRQCLPTHIISRTGENLKDKWFSATLETALGLDVALDVQQALLTVAHVALKAVFEAYVSLSVVQFSSAVGAEIDYLRFSLLGLLLLARRFRLGLLDVLGGKLVAALVVDAEDLDANSVLLFEVFLHVANEGVRYLGDMDEAGLAPLEPYNSTVLRKLDYRSLNGAPNVS